jgi:Rps23 Pro-64 3,4-dihydroxylase Tpa1-like proline 4-hydroxylase
MLEVHADFNWHDYLRLHRRLNVLIYLNPDWRDSYGGHLELWSRDMSRCEQRVLPIANRCVIFTTTDQSYHSNPEPVTCLQDRTRKSIALYCYTREQPPGAEPIAHSTLFQRRPR